MEENLRASTSLNTTEPAFGSSILRFIIRKVDAWDLMNWRLVNKECNLIATDALRRQNELTTCIMSDNQMDGFINTMIGRTPPTTSYQIALGDISLDNIQRFVSVVGDGIHSLILHGLACPWDIGYLSLVLPWRRNRSDDSLNEEDEAAMATIVSKLSKILGNLVSKSLQSLTIKTEVEIMLNDSDLIQIPNKFPSLIHFELLYPYVLEHDPETPLNHIFLVIVNRAPILDSLTIRSFENPNTHLIQYIPTMLFGISRMKSPSLRLTAQVSTDDIRMIQNLVDRNYNRLESLYINFDQDEDGVDNEEALWRVVDTLLRLQSETLTKLIMESYRIITPFQLNIPTLNKLKHLSLYFVETGARTHTFLPFTSEKFPELTLLSLGEYNSEYKIIDPSATFPNVTEFNFWKYCGSSGSSSMEYWHINFPNISILSIHVIPPIHILKYILTHLTRITHLTLGSTVGEGERWEEYDAWTAYTGGQPILTEDELLSLWNNGNGKPLEPPISTSVNGIYEIPSLGNMQNLKEMSIWTGSSREIQGIVYMSRPGGIPSLEKLTLGLNVQYPLTTRPSRNPTYPSSSTIVDYDAENPQNDHPIEFNKSGKLPSERSSTTSDHTENYFEYLSAVASVLDDDGHRTASDAALSRFPENEHEEVEDEEIPAQLEINYLFPGFLTFYPTYTHEIEPAVSNINPAFIDILKGYHNEFCIRTIF